MTKLNVKGSLTGTSFGLTSAGTLAWKEQIIIRMKERITNAENIQSANKY